MSFFDYFFKSPASEETSNTADEATKTEEDISNIIETIKETTINEEPESAECSSNISFWPLNYIWPADKREECVTPFEEVATQPENMPVTRKETAENIVSNSVEEVATKSENTPKTVEETDENIVSSSVEEGATGPAAIPETVRETVENMVSNSAAIPETVRETVEHVASNSANSSNEAAASIDPQPTPATEETKPKRPRYKKNKRRAPNPVPQPEPQPEPEPEPEPVVEPEDEGTLYERIEAFYMKWDDQAKRAELLHSPYALLQDMAKIYPEPEFLYQLRNAADNFTLFKSEILGAILREFLENRNEEDFLRFETYMRACRDTHSVYGLYLLEKYNIRE